MLSTKPSVTGFLHLTRRVLLAAALAAVLTVTVHTTRFVAVQQARGWTSSVRLPDLVAFILALAASLAVPVCGYIGARMGNRTLTGWFCCCNLLGAFGSTVQAGLGLSVLVAVNRLASDCAASAASGVCPYVSSTIERFCASLDWGLDDAQSCYGHVLDNLQYVNMLIGVSLAFLIPAIAVQCLGWWWGTLLYRQQFAIEVIQGAPACPAVMEMSPKAFTVGSTGRGF